MTENASQSEALTADFEEFQKTRNEAAFKRIYDKYVGLIQYVVSRCGAKDGEVDEIVQEVFLRFFKSADRIQGAAKLKYWLVTTARNLVIDEYRKVKNLKVEDRELDDLEASSEKRRHSMRQLEIELLAKLIEGVSETDGADDLKLFYVDGLSTKEIAEKKGEGVSTVTTRLTRLRRKFGDHFKEHIEELRATAPFD